MHGVENKTSPSIFLTKFWKSSHSYLTNFSAHNFLVPTLKLKKSFYQRPVILEQHCDSSRKNLRNTSKIPDYYKRKTSFNVKGNKLFLNRKR